MSVNDRGIAARAAFSKGEADRKADNARAAVEEAEKKLPPVVCLGRKGGVNVYYSRSNKGIFELTPERHTRLPLLQMAPLKAFTGWLMPGVDAERMSGREEKSLLELAARRLLEETGGRIFAPDCVRAAGIWAEPGKDSLVYNCGNACYLCEPGAPPERVDSLRLPWVYAAGDTLPEPADPLTDEQGRALVELLAARSWAFPYTGELLAGWLVNALFSGCMPFRGHVWINAPRNSGKTALRDELKAILGEYGLFADSTRSTPAGLYRGLKGRLLPIVCDEQEGNARDKRTAGNIEGKLEIARMASNASPVEMADKNGGTVAFTMRHCFLFFSVDNSLSRETDITRWGVFRLKKCNKEQLDSILARQKAARLKLGGKDCMAGALVGRVLQHGRDLLRNIPSLVDALREAGAEPRRAEMFAGWLAGAHLLTKGGDMSPDDIRHAVDVTLAYMQTEETRNDFWLCIDELRAFPVQFKGARVSLSTLCREYDCAPDGENRADMQRTLNSAGVIAFSLEDFLKLDGSPAYLRKIYAGTEFEQRAFSVLTEGCYKSEPNMYGCRISTARYPRAKNAVRAIFIPAQYMEGCEPEAE